MSADDIKKFWDLVVDVWQNGVGGVDIGQAINALLILFAFFVLRGLIAKFLVGWLRRMAQSTEWKIDDNVVDAIAPPLRAIPVVFGIFVAANYMQFEGVVETIAENVTRTLIAIVIFWAMLRAVGPLSRAFKRLEEVLSRELIDWIMKAMRVAVILVGAATVLQIWGIQIGPIIAGAGLFGVAVALGAQDLFKNLIAGILILGEKRFRKGDWIRVEGVVEGTVEAIGFRSTMVRRFDQAPVMVPNAQLSDTAVTNFSDMTYRRIYWHIGVEYRTTVDQLREIREGISDYIDSNDEFVKPTEASTFVRIDRFSDSSIDILVYCFTYTKVWGEWLEIKERLAYKVMDIVHGAGAGFAFPSTSLYVESLPEDRPETFVPPGTRGDNTGSSADKVLTAEESPTGGKGDASGGDGA
ncbi:MAG: mechanosensitive ion channel family protein [Rhodospirillales bacterium]|nr:mechanosensitive ion channel family protein [Rhodospirillales bacterium]MBO6787998.1 mechanosensitive ion channel family protein [Rhodospirillales bacterium]